MTAPAARAFSAGQVMTVLVGSADRAFCTWGQLLDVLGWLLQDVPLADRVDAAIERARDGVQRQHPDLVAYTAPPAGASDSHLLGWLADIENRHGFEFELAPVVGAPAAEEAEPDV
jgi:hypothetical protein